MKKEIKNALLAGILTTSLAVVGGCGKDDGSVSKQEEVYNLAVEAGYEGTYEEWLASIKGERGEKGEDGHTPLVTIGSDGYWYIDGVTTGVKAAGETGESPVVTIENDGYWYIDGEATTVKATGENGKDGSTWLTGGENPTSTQGKDGDFYFNSAMQTIYYKENNVWVLKSNLSNKDIKLFEKIATNVEYDTYKVTYEDDTTDTFNVKTGEISFELDLDVVKEKYINAVTNTLLADEMTSIISVTHGEYSLPRLPYDVKLDSDTEQVVISKKGDLLYTKENYKGLNVLNTYVMRDEYGNNIFYGKYTRVNEVEEKSSGVLLDDISTMRATDGLMSLYYLRNRTITSLTDYVKNDIVSNYDLNSSMVNVDTSVEFKNNSYYMNLIISGTSDTKSVASNVTLKFGEKVEMIKRVDTSYDLDSDKNVVESSKSETGLEMSFNYKLDETIVETDFSTYPDPYESTYNDAAYETYNLKEYTINEVYKFNDFGSEGTYFTNITRNQNGEYLFKTETGEYNEFKIYDEFADKYIEYRQISNGEKYSNYITRGEFNTDLQIKNYISDYSLNNYAALVEIADNYFSMYGEVLNKGVTNIEYGIEEGSLVIYITNENDFIREDDGYKYRGEFSAKVYLNSIIEKMVCSVNFKEIDENGEYVTDREYFTGEETIEFSNEFDEELANQADLSTFPVPVEEE